MQLAQSRCRHHLSADQLKGRALPDWSQEACYPKIHNSKGDKGHHSTQEFKDFNGHEAFQVCRHITPLPIAAVAQLCSHGLRDVTAPICRRVEACDADRVAVLAFQEAHDDGLEVDRLVCLAPCAPVPTKILKH